MKIVETSIKDLLIFKPKIHVDSRGYFFESFKKKNLMRKALEFDFVQDNESRSEKNVLRGFHFQKPPFAQTKLVRCVVGEILDVALDIRTKSSTYGKYESIILNDSNKFQFLIPKGFAHAFIVRSEYAVVSYKVDNYYSPDHDCGISWEDPITNFNWGVSDSEIIISEKDKSYGRLSDLISPF